MCQFFDFDEPLLFHFEFMCWSKMPCDIFSSSPMLPKFAHLQEQILIQYSVKNIWNRFLNFLEKVTNVHSTDPYYFTSNLWSKKASIFFPRRLLLVLFQIPRGNYFYFMVTKFEKNPPTISVSIFQFWWAPIILLWIYVLIELTQKLFS